MSRQTIKPNSEKSGVIVTLGPKGKRRRVFNLYSEVLPGGVTFEATGEVTEHNVDKGAFPDDEQLKDQGVVLARKRLAPLPSSVSRTLPLPPKAGPPADYGVILDTDYRIRLRNYRAQDPVTVAPDGVDGYTGCVVLINIGSHRDSEKDPILPSVMRAFEFDSDLLPNGVTFVPPSDGMVVIEVKAGGSFPTNEVIAEKLLPKSIARDLYAGPTPQGVPRKP